MQTGEINNGRIMQNGIQASLSISPESELMMCFDGMGSDGVGGCKQERDRMAWQAAIMDALDALLSLASIESDENTDVMAWLYRTPFGQNTLHDFLTKASDRELRAAHTLIGAAVRDGSFGLVFEEVNCIALDMANGVYASKQSKDVYIVAFCAVQVAQKLNNSSLSNTEYKPLQVSSQK